MLNSELLKKTIIDQRELFLRFDNTINRDILTTENFKKIKQLKETIIITGARRCGKSYLMKLIWQNIKEKIAKDNFLYVNFEDEKLLNFKVADFELLMDNYFELFNVDYNQKIYLFFDEIQNIAGWEKFLNRLMEEGKYKIFVTGSNASLLSKEISTSLTGRHYPINLFPLSFKEIANYKIGYPLSQKDLYKRDVRIKLIKLFDWYTKNGGFPEVVLQNFRPLLQEYLKNIIYRDIVSRYRIKKETSLRELTAFVMSNIATPLSLEKISKMTKIKNITTVKNYLSYLENSFLFFFIQKFSYSIKQQIYNPKKIFSIDTGMYNEIAFINSSNEGRVLENLVLIELKRRDKNIFYNCKSKECDFIIQEKNKVSHAIQVTKILSPQNDKREIEGLLETMNTYKLKEGLILTNEQSEVRKIDKKIITIMPIWQWLLS